MVANKIYPALPYLNLYEVIKIMVTFQSLDFYCLLCFFLSFFLSFFFFFLFVLLYFLF